MRVTLTVELVIDTDNDFELTDRGFESRMEESLYDELQDLDFQNDGDEDVAASVSEVTIIKTE